MAFELWLEFEQVDINSWQKNVDFCNIHVRLKNGVRYGLTVWTFDYFQKAIEVDQENGDHLHALYLLPPDLFVKELSRDCIERSISDLLQQGPLEEMLNPSVLMD